MNQHLSNVLRQDLLAPASFEVCLKNPLKDECWAWDITHIDMGDFVKSMPPAIWEAKWVGTNTFLRGRMKHRPSVGITNINNGWTAWLPLGDDFRFRIEWYFSRKLHLTRLER
jgi:hypothetical protein